jgi:sulfur carrier protein ThiS
MSFEFDSRKEFFETRPGMKLRESLKSINMNPESVLAVRGGVLLTDDEIIKDGDRIKLVPVSSRG